VRVAKAQIPGRSAHPSEEFSLRKAASPKNLQILQANLLSQLPWLVHGFSTRGGGISACGDPSGAGQCLNLGFTEGESRENVVENRRRFLAAAGAGKMWLVPLRQFHSDLIWRFERGPADPRRGDASMTARAGVLLGVQTADCVPILLADTRNRCVAAVHAGWRGTLRRIVQKTIGRMQMEFGTRPEDVFAALGPAIGGCCYEVGTEVAHAFQSQFANAQDWFDELRTGDEPNPLQWLNQMPPGHQPPPKNVRLDFRAANRSQLLEAGVSPRNIVVSDLCTACRTNLLFSYRKEGSRTGRLMAVIGIRP